MLFGVDEKGKPKAARFLDKHANLATKAAAQLNLQVLQIVGPAASDLAARLPQGRIHANGRGFIPYIRRDLYSKLVAAAGGSVSGAQAETNASAASSGQPSAKKGDGPSFPENWDSIKVGDVVIALVEPGEGWLEALVAETHGDMLTLRWRHHPRDRRFSRHRLSVGLMCPHGLPAQSPGTKAPVFPAATKQPQATSSEEPAGGLSEKLGRRRRRQPRARQRRRPVEKLVGGRANREDGRSVLAAMAGLPRNSERHTITLGARPPLPQRPLTFARDRGIGST